MTASLDRLYGAAREFAASAPALSSFRAMAADPPKGDLAPSPVPALAHLARELPTGGASPDGTALTRAVLDAAADIHWLLTYDEAFVGADFLARYGWFELLGPTGHFRDAEMVAFIAYWGPGLRYPWHKHQAAEIYAVVDGAAVMEREGAPPLDARPGDTSSHTPWQAHALRTENAPVLVLALQAGAGLNDVPILLPEPCEATP